MERRPLGRTGAGVFVVDLPPLTDSQLGDPERLYDECIRAHVHDRW